MAAHKEIYVHPVDGVVGNADCNCSSKEDHMTHLPNNDE